MPDFPESPSSSTRLNEWVDHWTKILAPADIHWCDGSEEEYQNLCQSLLNSGTFVKIPARPNSFLARSDPADTARVEDRTYIATKEPGDAGPTNNWRDPDQLKEEMLAHLTGSMKGRTMFVVPFCMGPLGSPAAHTGVQITDSAYVAASMKIMTRMGTGALKMLEDRGGDFVPCIHSVGYPLAEGQKDVAWPCNAENKYISHFPETKEIWSYGSGYGGNALLGKKCFALRIASSMAQKGGWMAEHMLILGITPPGGEKKYIAAAFPSACGKTNMAMMIPALKGWEIETVGDDIAWLHFGQDGKLYAINPEAGYFGVAPGTSPKTNSNALAALYGNCIFTNVAETAEGDIWWEGLTNNPPDGLTDWRGSPYDPASSEKAAHPNARFTVPSSQCPCYSPEAENPQGVPISAILFGGRRASTVPLVTQAKDWSQGVFLGSILSSETTAAAAGKIGSVRFDPFAMLPFTGYNMGDYINHWLEMGKAASPEKLPRLFWVNWFQKNSDGSYLWPGFGENSRVLKWVLQQLDQDENSPASETPIGIIPKPEAIDQEGLDQKDLDLKTLLEFNSENWVSEVELIENHFKSMGDRLPDEMWQQLEQLKQAL